MIRSTRLARWALGLMVLLAGSASLPAVDIIFDLSSGVNGLSSVTKTVSGYSMTLAPIGISSTFEGDGDGLVMGTYSFPNYIDGFTIQVTGGSLNFLNYTVGWVSMFPAKPFDLTGGTGTSTNNTLGTSMGVLGNVNFNGSYSIAPGQTVSLKATGMQAWDGYSAIQKITFSTVAVPEPSTYALAAIATGVMAAIARRRKAARA